MAQPTDQSNRQAGEIGRRQSLFREVNERIDELSEVFDLEEEMTIFCECGSENCHEQITITGAEYEKLRRVPTNFAVVPGHDVPAVERVIARSTRYVVVEKFGAAASAAIKLTHADPSS